MRMRIQRPAAFKILRSQRGMALLLALFAMTLLTFIAVEVSYDTSVDYVVAAQQVNRIKAYYAAKSAVELSLLRINFFKQAIATLGDNQEMANRLEIIWSFPFMWPPTLGDAKMTEVDKGMIKEVVSDSLMSAQYAVTITPESGKLDINDLGSDSKKLREGMIKQLINVFKAELEHNEEFAEKYSGYNFTELVNNIADYIDEDSEGLNGGDESAPYRDFNEPGLTMPPNRPLRTLDELHQVGGMKDDFYNVLAPRVTVFGTKGINVNYAAKDVLMGLDESMTDEAVDRAIARRSNPKEGGPFKDEQDFYGFIQGFGVNVRAIQERKPILLFDMEFNFRISATGLASNVKREITAVTYDYDNLTQRLAEYYHEQDQQNQSQNQQQQQQQQGQTNQQTQQGQQTQPQQDNTPVKKKIKPPKGRPSVVYWEEN
jgi:general secretion pathway protein K